jgi:phenylacetate-CoA ligase
VSVRGFENIFQEASIMSAEFLPRNSIREMQLAALRRLLSAILPSNRFYAAKLGNAGVDATVGSLDSFSARAPFTTKSDLVEDQRAHPPFGTNLTYPAARYTRYHQTSGTTGQPLRWLDTPESWDGMVESWRQIFVAAGVGAADRILFAFSFGPFIGFWLAFEAGQRLHSLCLPAGGMSSEARLRLLLDNDATVLCCTPTYAIRLAEVAGKEGIDLSRSKVRVIVVAGEPGGSIPATRQRLEELWPGARVFDHHGMTEVGPVTYECPDRPGILHVIDSAYYAEIIDPHSGAATPSGEAGELVLTTLGRDGSPLLRYRTGDLVKAAHPPEQACVCGRYEMALGGGIIGRVDDMVVVRGVNIYPSAIEDVLRGFPEVAEYRVTVKRSSSLVELAMEAEPIRGCANAAGLARQIEKAIQTVFALRVPVRAVAPGALPRFEMKARRWVYG